MKSHDVRAGTDAVGLGTPTQFPNRIFEILNRLPNHTETQQRIRELKAKDNRRSLDYLKRRRKTDRAFRVLSSIRSRVRSALKVSGTRKIERTNRLVSCTIAHLIQHLESRFQPGMSWDNYGEWEIDHIVPCHLFDMRRVSQQRQCFHWLNLQPLWRSENRSKSGRYTPELHPFSQRKKSQKGKVGTDRQSDANYRVEPYNYQQSAVSDLAICALTNAK